MIALLKFFDRRSPAQLLTTALALMAAVAVLDYLTGAELSFSIFYLLPIVLVSWYSPRWQGYLFCGVSAIVWLLIDYASSHIYSNGLIPIWNSTVRFSFFLITATLLAELKTRLTIEKAMAKSDGLTGSAMRGPSRSSPAAFSNWPPATVIRPRWVTSMSTISRPSTMATVTRKAIASLKAWRTP